MGPSTEEHGIKAAMKDLSSFGFIRLDVDKYARLMKYAELLNDPRHLDVFWAHGGHGQNMKQKISYLDEAFGFRTLNVPLSSVKQQDRNVFTQSKRDALEFMITNRVDSKAFSNHDLFLSSCLLEDKVTWDVFGTCETYVEMRDFLLTQIKKVMKEVLGVSSSCQLSQACSDY